MKSRVIKFASGVACLVLLGGLSIPALLIKADEPPPSAWLGGTLPGFNILEDAVASLPNKFDSTANNDCSTQIITTKSAFKLVGVVTVFPPVTFNDCIIQTTYGSVSSNGYLTRPGTNLAGKVYRFPGEIVTIPIAVPNSNKLLFSDNGSRVRVVENADSFIVSQPFDHQVKHFIGGTEEAKILKDQAGNNLELRNIIFTPDGKWMIGESRTYGIYRLNLDTYQLTFFQKPFDYNSGLDPMPRIAISGDGRYAVIASARQPEFKLYDLSTCIKKATPNSIEDCKYRDLLSFVQGKATNYRDVSAIRFSDDYTLTFYLHHRDSASALKISYVSVTAPGYTPVYYNYLGLGDSFASGEGAYEYRHGTDVKDPFNKCHLSNTSYPYLLATQLNLNTYQSIACSGAKKKDIIFADTNTYKVEERQSKGKESAEDSEIFDNFLVGYRTQIRFVEKYRPGVVTLSIGGNDIGFGDIVARCLSIDTCYGLPEERWALAQKISGQFDSLVTLYEQTKNSGAPGAKIYIIGYPSLTKEDGDCAANVHANAQELKFFNDLVSYLNFVISQATLKAGVSYVDAETTFTGSRLCETSSSQVAVNGLTAGNDKFLDIGPFAKESFHPNRIGHSLFKDRILQATNNFTLKNPKPVDTIPNPGFTSAAEFVGVNLPPLTAYQVDDDNMIDGLLYHGGTNRIQTEDLAPLSEAKVEAHSTPINLGSFITNPSGALDANITIPTSISPGFHEIHVVGKNIAGEDVDIQKLVYIAASEHDYDGDGTPNTQEKCLAVEPANQDYDKDGIDDACDGQISEPPPPEPPLPPDDVPIVGPIELPDFTTLPNKESQSAGETVAGNEELAPSINDPIVVPATATIAINNLPLRPRLVAAVTTVHDASPQTLGVANSTSPPAAQPPDTSPQPLPNSVASAPNPKVSSSIPYLLILFFMGALMGLLYFLKYRKSRS